MYISAARQNTRDSSLLMIALSAIINEEELPTALREYLCKISSQAEIIAKNPLSRTSETLPEAIQLAVDIQSNTRLRDTVHNLSIGELPSAEEARKIITKVESDLAFYR